MDQDKDSLIEEAKNRIRTPFYGSLAIAFLILNWRAALVILHPTGEMDIIARLNWIDGNLYQGPNDILWSVFLGPFLLSAFSVSIVPWIVNGFYFFRKRAFVKRSNMGTELEKRLWDKHKAMQLLQERLDLFQKENVEMREQIVEKDKRNIIMENAAKDRHSAHLLEVAHVLKFNNPLYELLQRIHKNERIIIPADQLMILQSLGLIHRPSAMTYKLSEFAYEVLPVVVNL